MKKILLLLPLFLVGCTMSQKITYSTDDLDVYTTNETIPINVDVRVLLDNRTSVDANAVLFNSPRTIKKNDIRFCINSEKHYTKDTVVNQITQMMVKHFNTVKLFDHAYYDNDLNANYYLTGVLNNFYSEQQFSNEVAVGSSFELTGDLATAGKKTPGKVIIEIANLKLFKKDGTLVKDFGTFYKEYNDEYTVDLYCWCAYQTINKKLKFYINDLADKIRNEMQKH